MRSCEDSSTGVADMDDQLTEKIRAFLADPQAAERIAAIAGALGNTSGSSEGAGNSQPEPPSVQLTTSQPAFAPQQGGFSGSPPRGDPRLELFRALRPLVAEEKRGRLDDLVRIATVASLLGTFKK